MTPPAMAEILRRNAHDRPQKTVFTHLTFDGREPRELSWGALYRRASGLAARLNAMGLRQKPVLLVHPAGLEFAEALYGVLLARAIAVPVPVAQFAAQYRRLEGIAADCRPGAVLSTPAELSRLAERIASDSPLHACPWLTADDAEESAGDPEPAQAEEIAVLQYTSGSTTGPRGVAITHANLAHNIRAIGLAFETPVGGRIVSWLPHYHDMGLVAGILGPMTWDGDCVLMSPLSFLQRPLRWLEAISAYRGMVAGAPGFAYDLCVRSAEREKVPELDLSCWRTAFVGAEPVRQGTLQRFVESFGGSAFRASALTPCYGLAEATLMVTCKKAGAMPAFHTLSRDAMDSGEAAPSAEGSPLVLTGCGAPAENTEVRIVEGRSRQALAPLRVGEIWVAGPQVARGYWGPSGHESFAASLAGSGEARYLRTGDLGFLTEDGELVFVDRLKDIIVVNGGNYICHDLELAAGSSHVLLSPQGCIAVAIPGKERAHLVVIAEFPADAIHAAEETAKAVRASLFQTHGLAVQTIAFVPPGKISRTTSGKLQRRLTVSRLATGALRVLARHGDPLPEWSSSTFGVCQETE